MQVIGHGQDLTPARVRKAEDLQRPLYPVNDVPTKMTSTQEVKAVQLPQALTNASPTAAGCYLIGQNSPITGRVYNLKFGGSTIGREPSVEIRVDEPSVSARHAEIVYRADGVSIANLFATNGTRLNGTDIVNASVVDGDIVSVGNVSFLVRVTQPGKPGGRWYPRRGLIWWLVGGALLALLSLVLLL
jgi:hypothetical protein